MINPIVAPLVKVYAGKVYSAAMLFTAAITPNITVSQEEKCVMGKLAIVRCLQVGSLFLLSLAGSFAYAQTPVAEQALALAHDDPQLKWGPCPPFLPKGCGIAVLHGDPAKDNVDVFFKLPAKSTLPLHWHTSAERMVLVAGELHVTYDGQKTAVLKPGTYAYGPAKRLCSG